MPFVQVDSLRYFNFDSLKEFPITHAVFTRHGGTSRGPFAQLNVGATVGDEAQNVARNLDLAFEALERSRASLFDSWLVHGDDVLLAEAPRPATMARPPKADIVLTNQPEVSLFMRYADCLPLLFYDPIQHALGLAHAGWKGSLLRVAAKAVDAMQEHFGSRPEDLRAAIGPGISAERYEVGPEVVRQVEAAFGEASAELLPRFNGSTHLDLLAANRLILEEAGVRHIESAGMCTATHTQDWFSHRAEKGRTGRFGVLLALKPL